MAFVVFSVVVKATTETTEKKSRKPTPEPPALTVMEISGYLILNFSAARETTGNTVVDPAIRKPFSLAVVEVDEIRNRNRIAPQSEFLNNFTC